MPAQRNCTCPNCPGSSCTCGCQHAKANACRCRSQCRIDGPCGPTCHCSAQG